MTAFIDIAAIRTGNTAAVGEAYKVYSRRLLFYALKMGVDKTDAEDIVTNVFIDLCLKGTVAETEIALRKVLYKAVYWRCLDLKKSFTTKHFVPLPDWYDPVEGSDYLACYSELLQELYNNAQLLPPKYRVVFNLSYREGLETPAIASKLGLSIKTVRNLRGLAIEWLKYIQHKKSPT